MASREPARAQRHSASAPTDAHDSQTPPQSLEKQCHDLRNSLAAIQMEFRRLRRSAIADEQSELLESIEQEFAAALKQLEALFATLEGQADTRR